MKISSIIKYGLSLTLAGLLFYFAFRNVSVEEFLDKITEVNYWWVVLSIVLSLLSHWLRAYRWNLMLMPLGYQNLSNGRTFLAVMSGYLANLAFPRLGEVTRCGVMKRNEKIPMSISFGTVITERALDFLILLSLIVLDFFIEFELVYDFFISSVGWDTNIDHTTNIVIILCSIIILGVVGIIILKRILEHEFENALLQKAHRILTDIVNGLMSIRKVKNISGFVFATVGIWVFYYLMSYVIFFSISETTDLGFGAGLSILAAAGVAMAMPVQGGIGAYHTLVSGVLIIYGIEATSGLFFATLLHTSQLMSILLFGGLSALGTVFIARMRKTEMEIKP
ncbi:MAG: lysylphosphatidylglycerol synthase transmembrane domain-containing protein [Reichenbachiella sp.]|uniref:lysylphosphatidylglycerol synthase transmembrane domain-containing protein n=1 Tax=Reichenbachiella sp. TaxID=2184521 RepID=UPI0032985F73